MSERSDARRYGSFSGQIGQGTDCTAPGSGYRPECLKPGQVGKGGNPFEAVVSLPGDPNGEVENVTFEPLQLCSFALPNARTLGVEGTALADPQQSQRVFTCGKKARAEWLKDPRFSPGPDNNTVIYNPDAQPVLVELDFSLSGEKPNTQSDNVAALGVVGTVVGALLVLGWVVRGVQRQTRSMQAYLEQYDMHGREHPTQTSGGGQDRTTEKTPWVRDWTGFDQAAREEQDALLDLAREEAEEVAQSAGRMKMPQFSQAPPPPLAEPTQRSGLLDGIGTDPQFRGILDEAAQIWKKDGDRLTKRNERATRQAKKLFDQIKYALRK